MIQRASTGWRSLIIYYYTQPEMADQETVIVTGAASGIGEAAARRLALDGYRLALLDLQHERLAELAAELSAGGAGAFPATVDVRDEGSVAAAIAAAGESGRIVGLVTCAGISGSLRLVEDVDDIAELFAVNVFGTIYAVKHAVPLLSAGGGSIVCVASAAAFVGTPRLGAYAASKGAIVSFAKCAAVELAARGIRVNTVCPGIVDTPMTGDVAHLRRGANVSGGIDNLLDRLASPAEIAEAITFLISDRSAFVVGTDMVVDGGKLAR